MPDQFILINNHFPILAIYESIQERLQDKMKAKDSEILSEDEAKTDKETKLMSNEDILTSVRNIQFFTLNKNDDLYKTNI